MGNTKEQGASGSSEVEHVRFVTSRLVLHYQELVMTPGSTFRPRVLNKARDTYLLDDETTETVAYEDQGAFLDNTLFLC
jgi:hypothetical protein